MARDVGPLLRDKERMDSPGRRIDYYRGLPKHCLHLGRLDLNHQGGSTVMVPTSHC